MLRGHATRQNERGMGIPCPSVETIIYLPDELLIEYFGATFLSG
jgi:hypothetical protein